MSSTERTEAELALGATTPAATTPPPSQFFAAGTRLGAYEVVRLLGHGGMGAVYEAVHRDLRRTAAIKTLHGRLAESPAIRERFLREGQAACRVQHPNAVEVLDVGVEGDVLFLVMEFLVGEDLGSLLDREKRLEPTRIADILIPALGALAAAHDNGIVHRDLKPDNLFLCRRPGRGLQPKLVDFGISKLVDDGAARSLTGTADVLGTPYYMAPEQVRAAKDTNARSDQYAMGVILYEAVTGRRPFEGDTIYSIMSAIVEGKYPAPRSVEPGVPEALEQIIVRAMAREPVARFAHVRDLARALLPFASERTRLLHADEFQTDADGSMIPESAPEARAFPRTTSTLGSSASEVPASASAPRSGARRMAPWTVAGSLVVLGVAGGMAYLLTRPTTGSVEATPAASIASAASAPEASAQPRAMDAVVSSASNVAATAGPEILSRRVDSIPSGASVVVDGQVLGKTPVEIAFPPGKGSVVAELTLPGHAKTRRSIGRDEPEPIQVRLAPLGTPRPGAPPIAPGRPAPALAPR
jgi:serine/threonine protein kinase